MQGSHITKNRKSSTLSRRNFISIAAAGSVSAVPVVALAATTEKTARLPLPALTLDQQLKICISNLKAVIAAMHPDCEEITASRIYVPDEPGVCILINARSHSSSRQTGGDL